jgi:hypothetical protein
LLKSAARQYDEETVAASNMPMKIIYFLMCVLTNVLNDPKADSGNPETSTN